MRMRSKDQVDPLQDEIAQMTPDELKEFLEESTEVEMGEADSDEMFRMFMENLELEVEAQMDTSGSFAPATIGPAGAPSGND
jgi:hypothetical protein